MIFLFILGATISLSQHNDILRVLLPERKLYKVYSVPRLNPRILFSLRLFKEVFSISLLQLEKRLEQIIDWGIKSW